MSEHSIKCVKEWLKEEDKMEYQFDIVPHVRAVLALAERANCCAPADQPDTPLVPDGPNSISTAMEMRDRYHYALSQIEKARDYLLAGQPSRAVDALWRAKDGIE